MRRLLPLVPVVAAAVAAGLLWAHDATWSIWLGLVVVVLAIAGAASAANGRFGGLLALVAAFGLAIGTAAAASGLWLGLAGRESTVTVTHVRQYDGGKGIGRTEDYTLRLPDGATVAGPLRSFTPGSYDVGDHVDVVYDPTGLVRFPAVVGDRKHDRDAVGGPVAMGVALTLLVVVRLRRPLPPPPGGPRLANVRVADLRRRLDTERRDAQGGPAAPAG